MPDRIENIGLCISYTNIFDVEIRCEYAFILDMDESYIDPASKKGIVNEHFLARRYLPEYEKMNTTVRL